MCCVSVDVCQWMCVSGCVYMDVCQWMCEYGCVYRDVCIGMCVSGCVSVDVYVRPADTLSFLSQKNNNYCASVTHPDVAELPL